MAKVNTEIRIQVIEDFLQSWKKMAIAWHQVQLDKAKAKDQAVRDFVKSVCGDSPSDYEARRLPEYKKLKDEANQYWWHKAPKVLMEVRYSNQQMVDEYFEKIMDRELTNKRNTLIYRTMEVVGEITDASNLTVGDNGEINGFIIGKTGKAKVETISAGGWNIQCFHYRVLVKAVK